MSEPTESKENGRNLLLFIGGLFVLGLALALLLFGGNLFAPKSDSNIEFQQVPSLSDADIPIPNSGAPLNIGDMAHAFTLSDLEGNEVALSDFQGRPVLINFWATWCAPCRLEMPEIQKAFETHQDAGLAVLALNYDEQADDVGKFFYDELGLTFTPLLDEGAQVAEAYGAVGLPATFFIDPEGVVSNIHRGILTEAQIDAYLSEMMQAYDQ